MLRVLALIGSLFGAAGLSQFPEFSQQYLQWLGGQADALRSVVADFDGSASRNRLTRDEALRRMTGDRFLEDRRADLTRTFARAERLNADLEDLRAASPLMRLTMPFKMGDAETLAGTWADFRPALPITSDGFVAAAIGFLLGWAGIGRLGALARGAWQRARVRRGSRIETAPP